MIDATHLKAHRTAASLLKKGCPPPYRTHKGGPDSKLHAVCDGQDRPVLLLLSEGQMSDYKGAALTLEALPPAKELLADRGYDSDWYRHALEGKGITPCIPGRKNRKLQPDYDTKLYRQRHYIEYVHEDQVFETHLHPLRSMIAHFNFNNHHRRRNYVLNK